MFNRRRLPWPAAPFHGTCLIATSLLAHELDLAVQVKLYVPLLAVGGRSASICVSTLDQICAHELMVGINSKLPV
jgi:hypothetical protein